MKKQGPMTGIVATLGPATSDAAAIRRLIRSGVDVFRLNFSHGDAESHRKTIGRIRAASKTERREVGILQDLCGPKIRVGEMAGEGAWLKPGSDVAITTRRVKGDASSFATAYRRLAKDLQPGQRILLDDGLIELRAISAEGGIVRARVERGGLLKSRR